MIVVADSGPLIALARIGQFQLLHSLFGRLLIPSAVRDELMALGPERPGRPELASASWIQVRQVRDTVAGELLRARLGLGESEAIVLAIEANADLLLIDELRGRRVAEARGINKTGTVGILVLAKKRGLVPALSPLLDALLQAGFRMSTELREEALNLAGE